MDCARGVEDLALGVATLRGVLGYQRQIGRYEDPFLIGHVGQRASGVVLPSGKLPRSITGSTVRTTDRR